MIRALLPVVDSAAPCHRLHNVFHLHDHIDVISYYENPIWANNPVNLNENIRRITPAALELAKQSSTVDGAHLKARTE